MNEHPFIEQIEKHNAAISRICCSFCRNAEDRDDLWQEILMHLWRIGKLDLEWQVHGGAAGQ